MKNRKSVKALELLTMNGLCHIVNVSKNTLTEWMDDFNVYIPKSESQQVTYYHPESIDVLKFIKTCKSQNYTNTQIKEMLTNRNIPVKSDHTLDDIQRSIDNGSYKDNILTMMQTIGITVSKSIELEKEIKTLKMQQYEHSLKQAAEIKRLKREIRELKQQLQPQMEYERKKRSFKKLFETQSIN